MPHRLFTVAVAFMLMAAPLAAEICQVTCAEHAGHVGIGTTGASHHHHSGAIDASASHHRSDHARAPVDVAVRAAYNDCRHLDVVVSESRELTSAQPVSGITPAGFMSMIVSPLPWADVDS